MDEVQKQALMKFQKEPRHARFLLARFNFSETRGGGSGVVQTSVGPSTCHHNVYFFDA